MSGYYIKKTIKRKPRLSDDECKKIIASNKAVERTFTYKIAELNEDFNGISVNGNKKTIIKAALPGEVVETLSPRFQHSKDKREPLALGIKNIITPSKDRVTPICPHYGKCGGCQLLHVSYTKQLSLKTSIVNKIALKYGCHSDKTISANEFHYRNKVHLVFTKYEGKVAMGFFNEESHAAVPIKDCPLHGDWLSKLIKALSSWANNHHLSVYEPWTGKGLLRFAVARYINGALMLTIVATERIKNDDLKTYISKDFKDVAIYTNINTSPSSQVFSDEFYHLPETAEKIKATMLGTTFALGNCSFFQINTQVAELIYAKVANEIKRSTADTVVDAYSGIGITSVMFAKTGKKVISIEIVKKAVEDARELAAQNGVKLTQIVGDCNEVLSHLDCGNNSIFFVDPPRKGLGKSVCRSIMAFSPKEIIYLSCNPETLDYDLYQLTKSGYALTSITPYDMFPQTKHVETLCILKKLSEK